MKKLSELCIANGLIAAGPFAGTPCYNAPYYWWIEDIQRREWVRREMQRYGNKLLALQVESFTGRRYKEIVDETFARTNMTLAEVGKRLSFEVTVAVSNELTNFFKQVKFKD